MKRCATLFLSLALVLCSWQDCQAGPISIVVNEYTSSDDSFTTGQLLAAKATFETQIALWTGALSDPKGGPHVTVTISTVDFVSLALGNGGSTVGATAVGGLPGNVTKIKISTNTDMFYDTGTVPKDQKSAATVMLHELGHAVGFNYLDSGDGYQKWNDRITGNLFDMFGTNVTMAGAKDDANGLSHIDTSYAANDLMNLTIGYGPSSVRPISQLDLCMLAAAYGYQTPYDCPEPGSMTLLGLGVAGMAGYGWRRRK
jgi:PEP-CTERM motif